MKFCIKLLVVSVSLVVVGCSSTDSNSNKTSGAAKACETTSDCGEGQTCSADPDGKSATGKICFDIECNKDEDCANGGKCQDYLCVGGKQGGTDGTGGGCTADADCEAGAVCVVDTGECVKTPSLGEGTCKSCDSDDNSCGEGQVCVGITANATNKYCLKQCTSNATCPSGWLCGTDGSGPACVPGLYQCSGCMETGCPDGEYCLGEKGVCAKPVGVCGTCTVDGQCGPGKRCIGKTGSKKCVPECPDGNCKNGGICKANEFGVPVCEWPNLEAPCCLVDGCGGSQVTDPCEKLTCAGATPHCTNGACVECTKDEHCTASPGQVCSPTNKCVDDNKCEGETPHWNAGLSKCCQCANDTHCGAEKCDGCFCKKGDQSFCDTCTGSYPGCVEYEGQWVCVQCSEDSHCSGVSKCNMSNYTCEGGGPGSPPPGSGDCVNKGCETSGTVCDKDSGLCYNPDGSCDNVTVFCNGGMPCVDIMSKLGGGGGGLPIPPLPGGGSTPLMSGKCGCELNGQPYWSQGTCPDGLKCGPHMECWESILGSKISDFYCDPHDLSGLLGALAQCPKGP